MVCPVCSKEISLEEMYEIADRETDQRLCRGHTRWLLEMLKQRRAGLDPAYVEYTTIEGEE